MSIHIELEEMYLADKADREELEKGLISESELHERDSYRLKKIVEIYQDIDWDEIWNCHYASLIYHHSNQKEHHKKAHELAKRAVDMGSSVSKWLYAATLDRWLVSIVNRQKFGTQYYFEDGRKQYYKSDGSVSEAKKKEYGVT